MKLEQWRASCAAHGFAAVAGVLALLLTTNVFAAEKGVKLEVQLLWGTNDSKSPDPKHKKVEPEVKKKLADLPLKWSNYFEVNRKVLEISAGASRKEELSDKCLVEIKNNGRSKVEVSLIGAGQQVITQSLNLPKGEALVVGGNAPNSTSWLIFLKRID